MENTAFTGIKWLNSYKEEIRKIKDHSPLLSVLCISAGIEFLGKLLCDEPLDSKTKCEEKFNKALSTFASLNKYDDKDLYHLIRCGLAHRISVKEGIILDPSHESQLEDSVPIRINPNRFFEDFEKAVEEAQEKKDWPNSAATDEYVTVTTNAETGTTVTIINYLSL